MTSFTVSASALPYTPTPTPTQREREQCLRTDSSVMWLFWCYTDQPTWGERRGEVYVCTFIQPQYGDWIGDTMAHLYYTVLYYTTLPYLSIYTFTRTGNPVCYLPTYLLGVSMVWYDMVGGKWILSTSKVMLFLK